MRVSDGKLIHARSADEPHNHKIKVCIQRCLDTSAPKFNGKTRRFFTSLFLPVAPNRKGDCTRCGACCKFVVTCPFLRCAEGDPNSARCAAYSVRPPQCRKYPRTKDEQIHQPCGFRFEDGGE